VTDRVVFTAGARADAVRQFPFPADRPPAARGYTGLEKALARPSKVPERHPVAEDESEQRGVTVRQMLYGRRPGVFHILFIPRSHHRSRPGHRHAPPAESGTPSIPVLGSAY
jgi:hypothetical protein